MKTSVFIVWLEGVDPETLLAIPSLAKLAVGGIDLQLIPSPLVEKGVCYYQVLTGMGSGKFGRFDAVYPERYKACEDNGVPEGVTGRLLLDILRSHKLSVTFLETSDRDALATLADLAYDCALVRLNLGNADFDAIDSAVQFCAELTTSAAHVLVLTDVWNQPPVKLVNVNDWLADMGLLEVGALRSHAEIIWPETLAYGLGTGQVWVNLRGREQQGIVVSGSEYEEVREALINELRTNWLDPQTNEPIVEQVIKKEDIYTGEYLFKAPDLVVVYRPGYAASPQARVLDFDGVSVRAGGTCVGAKVPYARLIARGPHLINGMAGTAALVDVAPSVLYLLGQPVPGYIDGNIISSIFTQTYLHLTPVIRTENDNALLSDEEEDLIIDRLQNLGYLG